MMLMVREPSASVALQIDTPILILPSENAAPPPEGAIEHAGKRAEAPRPAATAPALRTNPLLESTCAISPRGHASHASLPTCLAKPARPTSRAPHAPACSHHLIPHGFRAHLTSCSPNFVFTQAISPSADLWGTGRPNPRMIGTAAGSTYLYHIGALCHLYTEERGHDVRPYQKLRYDRR